MKIAFFTLGCKVNQYETDLMMKKFVDAGYDICDFKEKADIYVINSCSVTNLSTRKTRQYLSRAKKMNGIVVLAGCYAQEISEDEKLQNVDIIIGNQEKNDIVQIVEEYMKKNAKKVEYKVSKIGEIKRFIQEDSLKSGREIRESIKIEDGCNNFCSYCIIPYVRGRVRSRSLEEIITEVKSLVKSGVGEVVLVGIEIASYGKDLNDTNLTLIDVIEEVSKVEGLKRIRLGSIEPRVLTEENIIRMSKVKILCPHFHISVQSLDNAVLKRMNRKYTREDIFNITGNIRKYFNDPAFTCDIIVGFPGETDEEFKNTIEGVKRVDFYEVHAFKYSKRKWTVAAKMENQVDGNVAQARSEELIALAEKLKNKYMTNQISKKTNILVESQSNGYAHGYTPNYIMTKVKTNECLIGKEIEVILEKVEDEGMSATIVEK
ncbi:MAG: tRNA (N(6)-L-threonylcarbamoyladenosine(37)-C(2))-methylthiotransferase MtaB [Clostridia bacterium]|nr:tRNA (N(6)-L-threonylcarbamoyladenosine(37)-C(2))-methylthiotransferase MtaB [Clostridia bacterium]